MENKDICDIYKLLGEISNPELHSMWLGSYKAKQIKTILDKLIPNYGFQTFNDAFHEGLTMDSIGTSLNDNIREMNGKKVLFNENTIKEQKK